MRFIFLMGPTNVGKSTQCQNLLHSNPEASYQPSKAVSPGAWIRDMAKQRTKNPLADYLFHNCTHETLGPVVSDYLEKTVHRILDDPKTLQTIVVDGYPRSVAEVASLAYICKGEELLVVELLADDEEIHVRGAKRKRVGDDNKESLDIRVTSYKSKRAKVIDALRDLGVKVHTVCGGGERQVFGTIESLIGSENLFVRIPIPARNPKKYIAARFMAEVRGMQAATIIQLVLQFAESTRQYHSFCGTHPISLTRENIPRIQRFPYLVSLKATGERYLCLVYESRLWFLGRSMEVYASGPSPDFAEFNGTLIDGELIGHYFLVLDCLRYRNRCLIKLPILERMAECYALAKALENTPGLHFRMQEYVDRMMVNALLRQANTLPWEIDGIIFQPQKLPYRHGIDYNMFKWKPLGENSADFYYNAGDSGLYVRSSKKHDPRQIVVRGQRLIRYGRLLDCMRPVWVRDGMILECVALPEEGIADHIDVIRREQWTDDELVWVPRMHRGDKLHPNMEWVTDAVVTSIKDNITQEELERACHAPRIYTRDAVKIPRRPSPPV